MVLLTVEEGEGFELMRVAQCRVASTGGLDDDSDVAVKLNVIALSLAIPKRDCRLSILHFEEIKQGILPSLKIGEAKILPKSSCIFKKYLLVTTASGAVLINDW